MLARAFHGDPHTRFRNCAACGRVFGEPRRKRGRPSITCSPECRRDRGRNGDIRTTRTTGGGWIDATGDGIRHSGGTSYRDGAPVGGLPVSEGVGLAIDALGDPGTMGGGWVTAFQLRPGNAAGTVDPFKAEAKRELKRERAEAERSGEHAVSDRYGMSGGLDVGRTCPSIPDSAVVGQRDLRHDWQARLDASHGWLCTA